MRKWSRAEKLTAAGVVVALAAIAAGFLVPETRRFFHLEPGLQATSVPPAKNGIKIVGTFAKTAEDLRNRENVLRMKQAESGKPLSEIPDGSSGFAHASGLNNPLEAITLDSQGYSDRLEVHKLASGQIELIGYVGSETFDRIRLGLSEGEAITFFSSEWTDAPNLVSVPLGSLKCPRSRLVSLDDEKDKHGGLISALDCRVD